MKNIILILCISVFIFSCKDKSGVTPTKTTAEVLVQNSWKLDRYSDENGKTISNSSLNIQALALYGLIFEFRANQETRASDKLTKNIVNKGTWALNADSTQMKINIDGFNGNFGIVSAVQGKLILNSGTDGFLSGVGTNIRLEFSESK
jgi:hypothetical protein